jgi:dTDP-4-amino-4,6-dideoxygalactose transaminase
MKIPLIKPYITEEVKKEVIGVLDSGFLTEGHQTRAFENAVKEYIGCDHVLAVCNCTIGLEIALRALGVGDGDEVIVPDYTYPATASVINIVGADIVLVDVDRETMLIDYNAIEKAITQRTKAIIPVSLFGNPLDYDRLSSIKEKHNLYIIEDAACSLGASYGGKYVGNLADISVFSLHPRKFITTGEGGLVTTNNTELANWMNSYKHFGMDTDATRVSTEFVRIGTNYKLSNIQAAVGLAQMKHVDELLIKRRELAQNYFSLLSESSKINFPVIVNNGVHSFQSFCVFVDNRNKIIDKMRDKGIETQIGSYSLHMHKAFNDNNKCHTVSQLTDSKYAFNHCLTLPMYHDMIKKDQEYVVNNLLKLVENG